MPVKPYRQYAWENSPTWLRDLWSEKLVGAFSLVFDMAAEAVFLAGASNLFDADSFPLDALPRLGSERMIERYPSESDANYKTRLKSAWDAWKQAGTSQGLIAQLAGLGLTAYTKENASITPKPYQWNWDSDTANFSRFWVVVTGHPWTWRLWGDPAVTPEAGVWGGDSLWAARVTPPSTLDARAVSRVILKWKPGHAVCPFFIIVMEPLVWLGDSGLPDGTWDVPENRNPGALYVPVNR